GQWEAIHQIRSSSSCASTSDTTATGNPYSRFEDLNSTHEAHRLFLRS
ncbi:unnamed protein product, partial [Brassica rapa]